MSVPISFPPDEVHLWCARLDVPPEVLAALERTLAADERRRAERLHREGERARWVAARGILRDVLARSLGTEAARLAFRVGERGKPLLVGSAASADLHFNLSHGGGLLLVALARGREVGVDVEQLARPAPWERIARRFFSASEQRALAAAAAEGRRALFFRMWTRREALGKALGEGVFHSLRGGLAADPERPPAGWWMYESEPAPGYTAALAVEGSKPRLVRRTWRARTESSLPVAR